MFELIMDQLPELQRLEQAVANIEQARTEAQGRHAQLVQEKPKEPALRSQLEGVGRELEVLERRRALAQADRARFIQSNHERLAALLMEAQASEGERVAEGASQGARRPPALLQVRGRYPGAAAACARFRRREQRGT